MKKLIIFSDVDATMLDYKTYSYDAIKPALKLVKQKEIPLILCTSKSAAEIKQYTREFGLSEPFVVENGGAIYLPIKYFDFDINYSFRKEGYFVIEKAQKIKSAKEILNKISCQVDFDVKGISKMSAEEFSKDSGISLLEAKLAKKREHSETFKIIPDSSNNVSIVKKLIGKYGYDYTKGGRYHSISKGADKGKACKELIKLFKKKYGEIITVAFGDSKNDEKMLKSVDFGYLVRKPNKVEKMSGVKMLKEIGPIAWNKKVIEIISKSKF